MQAEITNTFINFSFRYEKEIQAALQSGKDLEKILSILSKKEKSEILSYVAVKNGVYNFSYNRPQITGAKTIAIISITGFLSRIDSYYGISYNYIAQRIAECNSDPEIAAIVIRITSPGGGADGNYIFADAIAASKKRIVIHTSYCYSAAYFGACPAAAIVLDNNAASGIGSIGSMYIHTDYSKALDQDGIKVTVLRATGSENKALLNPYEPADEKIFQNIQDQVNDCREEFVGYVNRFRRGKIKSDALSGQEFTRRNAKEVGLVDYLGDLNMAIDLAMKLNK